jgi:hypothetical protein
MDNSTSTLQCGVHLTFCFKVLNTSRNIKRVISVLAKIEDPELPDYFVDSDCKTEEYFITIEGRLRSI